MTMNRSKLIIVTSLAVVFLTGFVQMYIRTVTATLTESNYREIFSILDNVIQEQGYSLLGIREHEHGYSLVSEYIGHNSLKKRVAIGVYVSENSDEIVITVRSMGWAEDTKMIVNEQFDRLLSSIENLLGGKLKIIKKSEPW